jgi:hypothetical protein
LSPVTRWLAVPAIAVARIRLSVASLETFKSGRFSASTLRR